MSKVSYSKLKISVYKTSNIYKYIYKYEDFCIVQKEKVWNAPQTVPRRINRTNARATGKIKYVNYYRKKQRQIIQLNSDLAVDI